jgi:hypothetical protein
MIKFKAINVNGGEVEGYGVLDMGGGDWILFLDGGLSVDINDFNLNDISYVYVKPETIIICGK